MRAIAHPAPPAASRHPRSVETQSGETKGKAMTNRITPYQSGWLTFLVAAGLATRLEAEDAMGRVARAAIEAAEERRREKRQQKRSRRKRREDD